MNADSIVTDEKADLSSIKKKKKAVQLSSLF